VFRIDEHQVAAGSGKSADAVFARLLDQSKYTDLTTAKSGTDTAPDHGREGKEARHGNPAFDRHGVRYAGVADNRSRRQWNSHLARSPQACRRCAHQP
jgi:hypothetical protein